MDATARLLALLGLLRKSARALTFQEIRQQLAPIDAYTQDDTAARRQFERDKRTLASLGHSPVYDTIRDGYRLERTARRLTLSDADVAWLEKASALASAGPLGPEVRAAIERVLAIAAVHHAPNALVAWHPNRDRAAAQAIVPRLLEACRRRLVVTFDYTADDGTPSRRRVDPYAVYARRGRWYLAGRCHARDACRNFHVTGVDALVVEGLPDGPPRFGVPAGFDLRAETSRPPWDWNVHGPEQAVLDVDIGLGPLVARRLGGDARLDGARVTRTVTHARGLDELLLELFPRVSVVGPPRLEQIWTARRHALAHAVAAVA